jgi:hypothetical protein
MLVDPTGWGATKVEAIADLLEHPIFQELADLNDWPLPRPEEFLEVGAPPETEVGFQDLNLWQSITGRFLST